jgi:hypothetical protein
MGPCVHVLHDGDLLLELAGRRRSWNAYQWRLPRGLTWFQLGQELDMSK